MDYTVRKKQDEIILIVAKVERETNGVVVETFARDAIQKGGLSTRPM
jgi:hypothetical protein